MEIIYTDDTMLIRLDRAVSAAHKQNRTIARFELTGAEFQSLKDELKLFLRHDSRDMVPEQYRSIPLIVKE